MILGVLSSSWGVNLCMCVQILPLPIKKISLAMTLKIRLLDLWVAGWPCLPGCPILSLQKVVSKPTVQCHIPQAQPAFLHSKFNLWSYLHPSFLLHYLTIYQSLPNPDDFAFVHHLPLPLLTWPHLRPSSSLPWRTNCSSWFPSIVFFPPEIYPAFNLIMSLPVRELSKDSLSHTM